MAVMLSIIALWRPSLPLDRDLDRELELEPDLDSDRDLDLDLEGLGVCLLLRPVLVLLVLLVLGRRVGLPLGSGSSRDSDLLLDLDLERLGGDLEARGLDRSLSGDPLPLRATLRSCFLSSRGSFLPFFLGVSFSLLLVSSSLEFPLLSCPSCFFVGRLSLSVISWAWRSKR